MAATNSVAIIAARPSAPNGSGDDFVRGVHNRTRGNGEAFGVFTPFCGEDLFCGEDMLVEFAVI